MRILLVEDDTAFAKALIRGLKRNGMNVDWARDGEEGRSAMKRAEHAITLLDIGLPTISGFEILKAVCKEKQMSPVLVITARDGLDDMVAALNLGADDYLIKPFELRAASFPNSPARSCATSGSPQNTNSKSALWPASTT